MALSSITPVLIYPALMAMDTTVYLYIRAVNQALILICYIEHGIIPAHHLLVL